MERFEEFRAVCEVRSWFPRGFVGVVLKALPLYEVMEFTSAKGGNQGFGELPIPRDLE